MSLRGAASLLALAAAWWVAGCGGEPPGPPTDPRGAVERLFRLAAAAEPLERDRVLDSALVERDRVGALEAVDSLPRLVEMRVIKEQPLHLPGRVAVDVEASLPGGGASRYTVQVEQQPDGSWRVVSIEGPGVEWPTRPSGGPGMSVSAPPGAL